MTKKEEAKARRAAKTEAERARILTMQHFEREILMERTSVLSSAQAEALNRGDTPDLISGHKPFLICGIDEAGRGPFAGPVVAGAVILDLNDPAKEILYLNDSKKLSEKKRELLYKEILEKAVAVGIGYSGVRIIDTINILQATYRAMRMAIANLKNVSHLIYESDDRESDDRKSTDTVSESSGPKDPDVHELVRRLIRYELPASSASDQEQHPDSLKGSISKGSMPADACQPPVSQQKVITPDYILADAVHIPEITIPQKGIIKGDAKSVSIAAGSIIAKVTRDHIMYEYGKLYPEYGFASHKGYGTAAHIAAIKEHGMLDIHRRSFIHFT